MNEKSDESGPIGEALAKIPLPEPSERFVQKVMIGIRESERKKISWLGWWRVPALGMGLASLLYVAVIALQSPSENIDTAFLSGLENSTLSHWVFESGREGPNQDEILQFALEEPGGAL